MGIGDGREDTNPPRLKLGWIGKGVGRDDTRDRDDYS